MRLRFWGVRGSIPTPGPKTVRYGGNTPCIEIVCPGEEAIVIDAGTGIRNLGGKWISRLPGRINLFITHTHWDHIHGFPFFLPIYLPAAEIVVYGPRVQISIARALPLDLKGVLTNQMDHAVFPVMFGSLQAKIRFQEIQPSSFAIGGMTATVYNLNHTVITYGYNFEWKGKKVAIQTDHEPFHNVFSQNDEAAAAVEGMIRRKNEEIVDHARGADLLVADAMYTPEEYPRYRGWGHGSVEHAVERAVAAGVKRLALFHHDPSHDDDFMDRVGEQAREIAEEKGGSDLEILVAREGEEIEV